MSNPLQRDMLVEIAFGADLTDPASWSWADVSGDVLSQSVAIQRGRADEAGETQPMTTSLTLDNIRGDYTPDNPVGAYYPNVRRGTPLRISVPSGESYFSIGTPQAATVTTPDAAPLDITGDLDVRVDFAIDEVDPSGNDLIGKFGLSGSGQRSWYLEVDGDGLLRLFWSADGTALINAASTKPVLPGRRAAYRFTLDVDNGAGGNTVTFYSAPDIDGAWTQFGDPIVTGGTTSIFNSTTALVVGDNGTAFAVTRGRVWAAQVYNGIGGALVADADFRDLDPGTTAFTDSVGRNWTVGGGGVISDLSVRFVGHVDEWAPSWPAGDVTGDEPPHSVVDVTASSVRRRMVQGNTQTISPLRGAFPAAARTDRPLLAYWPMEDGPDANSFGSAVSGGAAMTFLGAPRPAASDTYIASQPLPTFNNAGALGVVPGYTSIGNQWMVSAVVVMPEGGVTDEAVLLDIHTDGTASRWVVRYDTAGAAGQLRLQVLNVDGADLLNTTQDFDIDDKPFLLYVEGGNSGSNALWTLGCAPVLDMSTVPSVSAPSGTISSASAPRATAVGVGTGINLNNDIVIGHVAVYGAIQVFFFEPRVYESLIAYAGESAVDRFVRVCTDSGLDYRVYGVEDVPSELMGVQSTLSLSDVLTECATSDGGVYLDQRDRSGVLFRPRWSLYNQDPALVLDAAENGIANPFQPVLDDQRLRNDITVERTDGGSSRATDDASIADEGRYEDSVTLSLFTDQQTFDQAWWRLHLGTVPGMRYSTVTVDFDTAPEEVRGQWLSRSVDVGDLIRVRNLPRQHAPDDVDLIIQGYTETITPSRWRVTFNCSPGSPYRVPVLDDPTYGRLDSLASTLTSGVDEDDTSVSVTVEAGHAVWIDSATYPTQFPFNVTVAGEEWTVTAISGTSSPQTFTVTRSVNGVVKSHAAGEQIQLAKPVYIAL